MAKRAERARRRPQTARGKSTHSQLLKGAERAFYAHGYPKTSVAQICREARVANGTFYQYFRDKRAIFEEIVHGLASLLHQRLDRIAERPTEPVRRLAQYNRTFFQVVAQRTLAYHVFRQSEFVDLGLSRAFYGPLVARYRQLIREGRAQRSLSSSHPEATAWGMLGAQAFLATRWLVWEAATARPAAAPEPLVNAAASFLWQGLGCGFQPSARPLPDLPLPSRPPSDKVSTRKALLDAAEQLFGAEGFYATSISEVTRQGGVAQGTFYLYFPSKVAIFAQLVRQINQALIERTRRATAGLEHRRDIEQAGFRAFFNFIRQHPLAYRIVREAEFVDEEAGQGYYRRIAAGYVKGLRRAMERGQVRRDEPEPLAYALMGLGHFAGLKWFVWDRLAKVPEEAFSELMRFACEGLRPSRPKAARAVRACGTPPPGRRR